MQISIKYGHGGAIKKPKKFVNITYERTVSEECAKLSVVQNAYRNLRLKGKTVQTINEEDKAS